MLTRVELLPLLGITCDLRLAEDNLTIEGSKPGNYVPRPKPKVVTHPAIVVVGQSNSLFLEGSFARTAELLPVTLPKALNCNNGRLYNIKGGKDRQTGVTYFQFPLLYHRLFV